MNLNFEILQFFVYKRIIKIDKKGYINAFILGNKDNIEAEFGDIIFSLVNLARHYDINPENALERTNKKFISRFNYVEEKTLQQGKNLKDMTLDEMDQLWNEAKKNKIQ